MESKSDSENLMIELENLRQSNPALFAQAMKAIGLDTVEGNESKIASNFSINEMTEAIKTLRSDGLNPDKLDELLTKPAIQVN